ncbi:solute carrier organic anion transporter family member 4A1 isoform X2 [Alosa sapidissima]|uniref:solute carrier organic anion transporter family member 4A1 isoform X2 n=1 Tax=Alosa sapidissima TaxID=34773 RepID=UPI001C0A0229|nr:solute carrier organic anion transporter family member 4A1 isoform X2 [Alosa sapidissima]
MPNLLNADASFSSKQELLDLHDGPIGPVLDTPSPVESQADSPSASSLGSPVGDDLQMCAGDGLADAAQGLKFVPSDAENLCGWGGLTPRSIQTFNTPRWVLFFLCVASFLQGMIINGFINTVITSIERRFDLRSYQAGLIASSYDIAACVCLAFVSYFGGTGHKPRWLGWGVLVMALGSLVFALPHFTTPPYQVSVPERTGLCSSNVTDTCQDSAGSGLSAYRYVFMLGQFLHGVGATPLYTLGVTYLDENVKSSYAPVYIGSQRYVAMRVSEAHQLKDGSQARAADPQFGKTVKDMPRSVLLLLKNSTFIFLCLAGATEATLIAGMSTFGPKFLESQFNLSASEAATWFGYMVVPAGGGGTFLGGYIVKKLNLRCRGIVRFCMLCAVISLMAIFIFLVHCPNMPMAGVTAPYRPSPLLHQHQDVYLDQYESESNYNSTLEGNLTVSCNAGCHCVTELYNPVCGADGVMYYSPCHAGCHSINHTHTHNGRQVFSGCGCVVGNVTWGQEGLAVAGKCSSSCHHMPTFLTFLFIVILFTFLCSIPALTATLRCVPDSQRSFGLGIQWIVVRTLGGIPGPIAFGSVIDISCLLWQDQCGEQGSCYLYQNSAMSRYTLIAGIIYKVLGMLFFLLASVLYQPPPESPQSSCESTDHDLGDLPTKDLPTKDLPQEVITNVHARL